MFNTDGFDNFKFAGNPFQHNLMGFQDVTQENPMMDSHFGPPFSPKAKTHLGLASCKLIKDSVDTYPFLREVAVLLKRFLAVHDYNSSYLGK